MSPEKPDKILIVRNDKLGDFCLALPCFALLKACLPEVELHALVPAYTKPIADACPFIDQVIVDPGKTATAEQKRTLKQSLKTQQYSAALTLYSTTQIGWLLARCHIPLRIAPATKIAQIFHNVRLTQRRSRSLKPEYEYNLDLARLLVEKYNPTCNSNHAPPYIRFDDAEINKYKQEFSSQSNITNQLLIFVHPGSGGSANNLSLEQYAELIKKLARQNNLLFVISSGPGEFEQAHQVKAIVDRQQEIQSVVYESKQGLTQFAQHIAFADLFISGSTGPLHIAGALNRPTSGFYTNRQSATSLRWQTLSSDDRRLAFSPPPEAEAEDMSKVDLDNAANTILQLLSRLYT